MNLNNSRLGSAARNSKDTRDSRTSRSRSRQLSTSSNCSMKSNNSRRSSVASNTKDTRDSRTSRSRSRSRSTNSSSSMNSNNSRRSSAASNTKDTRDSRSNRSRSRRRSTNSTKSNNSRRSSVASNSKGSRCSRTNRSHSRSRGSNSRTSLYSNYSRRNSSRGKNDKVFGSSSNHSHGRHSRSRLSQVQNVKSKGLVERYSIPLQSDGSRKNAEISFERLMKEVRDICKTIANHHMQNDRRLSRIEVSINKALVRLGDITQLNTVHDSKNVAQREDVHSGEGSYRRDDMRNVSGESLRLDSGDNYRRKREDLRNIGTQRFNLGDGDTRYPDFPIEYLGEITNLNQMLAYSKFFTLLVNREKEFCAPGKDASRTAVISSYLKRFMSVRARSLLTLKESKNVHGLTLMSDFNNVYKFLIAVMREAYRFCFKSITEKEAHEALRIVWSRSKQLLNEDAKKRK